jgi:hypothetical protein
MASVDLDGEPRTPLPLMFTVALVLVLGSRFDTTRTLEAGLFAFGFPVLAVTLAFLRLRDSTVALRNASMLLAAAVVVVSELRVARAFEVAPPTLWGLGQSSATTWVLVVFATGAAVIQAAAAKRGMRIFAGAWVGMAAALAIYLPGAFTPSKDRFGQILAALMVALVAGGGPGFCAGALLSSLVKPREAK